MKKITALLPFLFSTACQMNQESGEALQSQLTVVLPEAIYLNQIGARSLEGSLCYFINVRASDIAESSHACFPPSGVQSALLAPSSEIELSIPSGLKRSIELWGYQPAEGETCQSLGALNLQQANHPFKSDRVYLLGKTSDVDLTRAVESVSLTMQIPAKEQHFAAQENLPAAMGCPMSPVAPPGDDGGDNNNIDETAPPYVTSAVGPTSGLYAPGQHLDFILTFNEAVNVTGTPRLLLTIGSATQYANYESGSGSSVINFRYTVQTGDLDADGIVVLANIDLNGGTLLDAATNPATLAFTALNTASVKVGVCPMGYVLVPASPPFCVAKYEMKNVGSVATSQAAQTPWVDINRDASKFACAALGSGFALISNAQWQAIARNVAQVPWNWSNGVGAGSSRINRGHTDNFPANALRAGDYDSDSCLGTGQNCNLSTWDDQRRVHQLSNDEYIWDFSGNVWEWVIDDYISLSIIGALTSNSTYGFQSVDALGGNLQDLFGPADANWSSTDLKIGKLTVGDINNTTNQAIVKGSGWDNMLIDELAGIFSTSIRKDHPQNSLGPNNGFRCVYQLP